LAERGGFTTCRPIGLALGALWLVTLFAVLPGANGARLEALLLAVGGILLLVQILFDARAQRPMESAAITLLGLFYVPFLMGFYIRLAQWDATGPLTLSRGGIFLAFYASLVVKFTDVGAYAAGMTFGRHKMFPRISPAKSWEGLAGGLLMSVIFSVGAVLVAHSWSVVPKTPLTHMRLPVAAGLGLLLGVVGVLGDLVESMFKRSVKAKDSSGVVPGLGGLLDVFDSLLFAPAVLYLLLPWL
jgi:phosphatidate cytidylyltransferase